MENKNKIIFFDYLNEGHHWFYNSNIINEINKIYNVNYITTELNNSQKDYLQAINANYTQVKSITNNKYKRIFSFISVFDKVIKLYKNKCARGIHFFTLDQIIIPLFICFYNRNIPITATLHWIPNQKLKYYMIRKFMKKNTLRILVHGEYIKKELVDRLGSEYENNVFVANYPIMEFTRKEDEEIKLLNNGKLNILYFGGTRYDKGVDILLESLKSVKSDFNLIVAGKEEYFKKEFIVEEINKLNCESILKLEYISDDEVYNYFESADIIVIPYRKIFGGQSGILTECINHNKVLIAPDLGQVGWTVKQYDLGVLYECENIKDLSIKIDNALSNYENIKDRYLKNQTIYKRESNFTTLVKSYENMLVER
ncbi:glycosyltransferase [Clostridium sp. YIM B02515]|uniref:Glycosyltransferase n=1 Tax=Clostridium rhizosphaerae TaxID=2803861 RepID=A0ABS1TC53_9CLOT|nr:glycosyltransferase [Clostridium rhizosphaerae]MBL4936337.1 glycosyltransferase [Clostridium rhizosphaerae]